MDRFDALRLFARIVELGSFTRAAAELDLPRATATYAIKQLEARLQARLLERTTRQVRATVDGQAFYERCRHILAELDDAEGALRGAARSPRGLLRVDMHGNHALRVVLPRIDEFHARYPHIQLAIGSGDRLVDLLREGVDCVVRSGHPRESSLVVRRLATLHEVVCASPAYLAEHGVPTHPQQLAQHRAVRFFASGHDIDYPFEFLIDGQVRQVQVQGWIAVNDAQAYVACALRGHGLIQIPRLSVEEHLADGRLLQVLPQWRAPALPVSVLYPQHRQSSPRLRVFVDWLAALYAERFGEAAAAHAH
ncbi:LysR family transcriptional regulator [Xanthomonas hyacinthi]|uniref:LysR family transcriptional regulator n=1 Tax=Xanthomonas hyacinthi TaxID=56455 RepID=A0A2S7EY61_9XANT|nr:LysR family transcriptional regulator [Xanthomonas hyacinthi]KLD77774.1 transcriptional regulator [Xanthomonas hyacinthi DSM 19077]PPU98092.1 LysR family transcriptional regulator [Xanthomonas hyacinthi]QGY76870.1 LysR family transcriptional regulator [Xanthomonas hyacinthi]